MTHAPSVESGNKEDRRHSNQHYTKMKIALVLLGALVAVCSAKSECMDDCNTPEFTGFGTPASKCGCCPWPCCCKCFNTETDTAQPCRALLDLSFIMDSSGSIGDIDWVVAKQFVADVVSFLTAVGTDQQVAMITYSNNATLEWNLQDPETSNSAALDTAINGLILQGGFTNTVEGMETAVTQVFGTAVDDPLKPNVAVVITDGRSNYRPNELASMSQRLQDAATVIAVGVTTEVVMSELEMITGDASKIFTVENFKALQTILDALQGQICPEKPVTEKCFCCCTPAQFFGGGGAYYYH